MVLDGAEPLESGPEILDLLRRHAIGVRRELFDAFAAEAIAQWVSVRVIHRSSLFEKSTPPILMIKC